MQTETKHRQHSRRRSAEPEIVHAGPIVLQVIPELHAGGAEQTTLDMGRALVKAQFGSIVVSESGRLGNLLRASGSEIIKLPVASKNPHTMWRNARAIAFYERWGFRIVGDHIFQLGADAQRDLIMERHVHP